MDPRRAAAAREAARARGLQAALASGDPVREVLRRLAAKTHADADPDGPSLDRVVASIRMAAADTATDTLDEDAEEADVAGDESAAEEDGDSHGGDNAAADGAAEPPRGSALDLARALMAAHSGGEAALAARLAEAAAREAARRMVAAAVVAARRDQAEMSVTLVRAPAPHSEHWLVLLH